MTEIILPYNRDLVAQETGFWCGPASAQMCLSNRGIHVDEAQLARECGTHTGGTDHLGLIAPVINSYIPDADYIVVQLPNDPPSDHDIEQFWNHLRLSIDNGFGMVINFVAPLNNKPFPIKGSGPAPAFYNFGTTYHYVSAHGYSDEDGQRAVWIADSGGSPFGYWLTLAQTVLIAAGKGYIYARPHHPVAPVHVPPPVHHEPVAAPVVGHKFWPMTAERMVTSPYGPRWGTIHTGVDFGVEGGSGGKPVYAITSGTVKFAGEAAGYGGGIPGAGWLVIDSDDGSCWEYGHIVAAPGVGVGSRVNAGDMIAAINPDQGTNGGVAPHLHLSFMPEGYNPGAKVDPVPVLQGFLEPGAPPPPPPAPELPPTFSPGTPLTGLPWHHSVDVNDRDLLLNIRAEGLLTQALLFAVAEKVGVNARELYEQVRGGF